MTEPAKRLADGRLTREHKRQKWIAKQSRKEEKTNKQESRARWFQEHSEFAATVSEDDVDIITSSAQHDNLSLIENLKPYFDVQDKTRKGAAFKSCQERLFIAEGTETIRLLIQQSTQRESNGLQPIQVKSIFVKTSSFFDPPVRLLTDVQLALKKRQAPGPGFQVLVGSEAVLTRVAGFPIARGALACGVVPKSRDESWLDKFMKDKVKEGRIRILALDGICDNANLGSMIRNASAFGVDVLVLSHDTCDCWYRRTIRVSMGHIFKVPIVRVRDLSAEIQKWSGMEFGLVSYATVLNTKNLLSDIKHGTVPSRWCCVMGNEGNGISLAVKESCTHQIRIDIESGVDSLSVPVAAGIFLNGLREREQSEVSKASK